MRRDLLIENLGRAAETPFFIFCFTSKIVIWKLCYAKRSFGSNYFVACSFI